MSQWKVTGVDRSGRRFRIKTNSRLHAHGINLYRGSVWAWTGTKWRLVKRVWN